MATAPLERPAVRLKRVVKVTPYVLARFVDWLADEAAGKAPKRQDDRQHRDPPAHRPEVGPARGTDPPQPSQGLALPHREEDPDEEEVEAIKVFSREQLTAVLAMAPERHKLLLELFAGCGLRISEAVALQQEYLGATPGQPTDLLFTNGQGGPLDPDNLRRRMLKPLVEEVGAPWAGFHTFRHTFASIHLSEGTNLVALSRALGHHSPAFTLSRYTHLLPGDRAPPLNPTEVDGIDLSGADGGLES